MILSHHITEQLLRERQRDLLREGAERRARAAACSEPSGVDAGEPRERWQPLAAAPDCRPA